MFHEILNKSHNMCGHINGNLVSQVILLYILLIIVKFIISIGRPGYQLVVLVWYYL